MMHDGRIGRRSALKLMAGGALAAGAGGALAQQKQPELIKATDELINAAKREGELYFRYSAQIGVTEAIGAEFTKKYGVKMRLERRVAAEGTNTFLAEERAGRHVVDVHVSTDRPGMIMLSEAGYYTPYKVENDADYAPSVKFRDFAYSVYMNTSCLPFNTKKIAASEAIPLFDRTWEGLLHPRFKNGRIGIISPFITIATSGWFWGLHQSPKYGEAFLKKVADMQPVIYSDQAIGGEGLFAGEVDVLIGLPMEECWRALADGASIGWTYPDILPAIPSVFHYISTHAPHPNAARLYVAWTLSREGAEAVSVRGGRTPTIKGEVPLAPAIKQALSKETWWKPMPDDVRFSPSVDQLIAQEDGFRQKMAQMFNIATRR